MAEPISQAEKLSRLSPYFLGGYLPLGLLPITNSGQGLLRHEAAPRAPQGGVPASSCSHSWATWGVGAPISALLLPGCEVPGSALRLSEPPLACL